MPNRLDGKKKTFSLKVCFCCRKTFTPTGCNAKRCPDCRFLGGRKPPKGICSVCNAPLDREEVRRCLRCRTRWSIAKIPGIGTGQNNPTGVDSPHYKSGIGIFGRYKKKKCERCGSIKYLCVHHKDHNRYNNDASNLETLCKRCHQLEHDCTTNIVNAVKYNPEVRRKISESAKNRTDQVRNAKGQLKRKSKSKGNRNGCS